MRDEFDVVIVGGGLVGGCLALALCNSPLKIAVVEATSESERAASPTGNRALALARASRQILEQLAVWREVQRSATPITHIHVSDRGHFGKTRIAAKEENVEALGWVTLARTLEQSIASALLASPVTVLSPARVIDISRAPESLLLTVRQGTDDIRLTARLLVGADGSTSTVRKLLGIQQAVRDYAQTAVVSEVATELDHGGTAYERFTVSGPLAFLPLGTRQCSVIWTMPPAAAKTAAAEPESKFNDRLQTAFGTWLGRIGVTSSRHCFPLRLVQARGMVAERAVLIGNAMHQIHPVAGQGFNLGLRDAVSLADRIQDKLALGEDIGEPAFLNQFAESRRRDLRNVIRFTDGLVSIFSSDSAPLAFARNIGLLAMDRMPPVKHLLARYAMGFGIRY